MWGKGGRILVHPWLWGQPQPGGQLPGLMQWGERVGCDSLCHQLAWLCFGVLGCGTARNQILVLLNLPRCRPLHSLAPFRNWQFLGLPLKKTDPSEARREKLYCLPWPSQHRQQTGSKHPQGSTSAVKIKKKFGAGQALKPRGCQSPPPPFMLSFRMSGQRRLPGGERW